VSPRQPIPITKQPTTTTQPPPSPICGTRLPDSVDSIAIVRCKPALAPTANSPHCDKLGYLESEAEGRLCGQKTPKLNTELTVEKIKTTICAHHTAAWCKGFIEGYGSKSTFTPLPISTAKPDPAQARYPTCWDLGRAAGQAAGGGPCPSGHSHNYCIGWGDGVKGITEDYTCDNPKQPKGIVAGCSNDKNSKANLAEVQPTQQPDCTTTPTDPSFHHQICHSNSCSFLSLTL
jgi:hypothetical protein